MNDQERTVLDPNTLENITADREQAPVEYPQTITLQHFWSGLIKGKYEPLSAEDKERITAEYFKYEPLTPLTTSEEEDVHSVVRYEVNLIDQQKYQQLIEHPIVYVDPATIQIDDYFEREKVGRLFRLEPTLVDLATLSEEKDKDLRDFISKYNIPALTLEEKYKLLSDVNAWHALWFKTSNSTSHLSDYGIKELSGYSIFGGNSELDQKVRMAQARTMFLSIADAVRSRTGKQKLNIFDIGGGSGRALQDMKNFDPNIETYNLSMDEEPIMYPVDHFVLCPAERMPKEFQEKMDIIISNMAFKYVRLPQLALPNVIKALAVGGEAVIDHIGIARMPERLSEDEAKTILLKAMAELRELQASGFIKVEFEGFNDQGFRYNYGRMKAIKKKSLFAEAAPQ